MSFASDTKAELCRVSISKSCCAAAEIYGILLYCNEFSRRQIKIITENRQLGLRLPKLFKKVFGISFDITPEGIDKPGKLIFQITDGVKLNKIFDYFGCDTERLLAHHINLGIIEEVHCRMAFMRGAFLAGGSVTDPEKRYHLELVTAHYNVSKETVAVLGEMEFTPKCISRSGTYIIYFKNSEEIEDFLTTIGAPVCAMEIMSAKVVKDLRNSVNRRVNCDTANVGKTVVAAIEQLDAIERLEKYGQLDSLPDKLRQTVDLRREYPEASISELAALSTPQVTKSCLNHRLRKIMELSKSVGAVE